MKGEFKQHGFSKWKTIIQLLGLKLQWICFSPDYVFVWAGGCYMISASPFLPTSENYELSQSPDSIYTQVDREKTHTLLRSDHTHSCWTILFLSNWFPLCGGCMFSACLCGIPLRSTFLPQHTDKQLSSKLPLDEGFVGGLMERCVWKAPLSCELSQSQTLRKLIWGTKKFILVKS